MVDRMTSAIQFVDIVRTDKTRIDLNASVTGEDGSVVTHPLWFEFSEPIDVHDDTLAVALSTLCGRGKYSAIHYGSGLSAQGAELVREFTHSTITAGDDVAPEAEPERSGTLLSFSGGFDSLAALSLMPAGTKLVSMDFGGRFSRERDFYEQFNPTIVSTNVTDTPLRSNSWSFMGIAAILASTHNSAEYHTFGSILEAGPDNLRKNPVAARNEAFPPFKAAGYKNAPYVLGLTEIGTLIALLKTYPEHAGESLSSLASPGEEKLYRKQVLASIVAERQQLTLNLPSVERPAKPHYAFGKNFALDFLALYVTKYAGHETAAHLLSGIPDEVTKAVSGIDLSFFEKANTTLYSRFPAALMGGLADKFARAGITFYAEDDWQEYAKVRALLSTYHPVVLK